MLQQGLLSVRSFRKHRPARLREGLASVEEQKMNTKVKLQATFSRTWSGNGRSFHFCCSLDRLCINMPEDGNYRIFKFYPAIDITFNMNRMLHSNSHKDILENTDHFIWVQAIRVPC